MRKISILGAFVAVLAFSALAVASASATPEKPEWLVGGKSLTEAQPTSLHGLLLLLDTVLGSKIEIDCTGLMHGTVGPKGEDSIELVLGLSSTEKDLVSCTTVKGIGGGGNCETGKSVIVHAINLPWHTLLLLLSTGTWDHIQPHTGGGGPGYEILCEGLAGSVSCTGEVLAKFIENLTNGALLSFIKENNTSQCSNNTTGELIGMGELLGSTVS